MNKTGFCIYIDTIRNGPTPAQWNGSGKPVVYRTASQAQRAVVNAAIGRFREFLRGERQFEDARTFVEYIVEVDVLPDGSVIDADGSYFDSGC